MNVELAQRIAALDGDEELLVGRILDRLDIGREDYGAWVAYQERRDLEEETLQELLDGVIYLAMRLEAIRHAK